MELFKYYIGLKSRLDLLRKKKGNVIVTDSKELYVDLDDEQRVKLGYSTDEIDSMMADKASLDADGKIVEEQIPEELNRDFVKNPIDLETEVSGILPLDNIDISTLLEDNYNKMIELLSIKRI